MIDPCGEKNQESLSALLRQRAALTPKKTGFVFYDTRFDKNGVSYQRLDLAARRVATALNKAAAKSAPVMLLLPDGMDFLAAFFGCCYAGAIAVPMAMPNLKRKEKALERLLAISLSCKATLAVAPESWIREWRETPRADIKATLEGIQWIAMEDALQREPVNDVCAAETNDIAFLQYTSGSTEQPKGIMVTHANLMANERQIYQAFGMTAESRVLSWLPHHHDMGFIGGLLQPIYAGIEAHIFSPPSFVKNPLRWLQLITETRSTVSGAPNFAYELCMRQITDADIEGLDLSSWTTAFCGAEQVRAETVKAFSDRFARCGFRREAFFPCYGLAESTLFVTGGPADREARTFSFDRDAWDRQELSPTNSGKLCREGVSCGVVTQGVDLRIVDPDTHAELPAGKMGEIWIKGPNVAKGYWNDDQSTAQAFQSVTANGEGPFLRTGDIGGLVDHELVVTGRLKEMIIVNGKNLFPQDVESVARNRDAGNVLYEAAAFSIDGETREELILALEIDRGTMKDTAAMASIAKKTAARLLENHDVGPAKILFLKARTIGRTTSGKLQRRALRADYQAGRIHPVCVWSAEDAFVDNNHSKVFPAPDDPLTQAILEICRKSLTSPGIESHHSLLEAGCDSLIAMRILGEIANRWGASITLESLQDDFSVNALASQVELYLLTKAQETC